MHDIKGLEQRITALHEAVSKLYSAKHADVLLPVIHRPGWTTLPEFQLVQASVSAMHDQVVSLHKSLDTLVEIAGKIGSSAASAH